MYATHNSRRMDTSYTLCNKMNRLYFLNFHVNAQSIVALVDSSIAVNGSGQSY